MTNFGEWYNRIRRLNDLDCAIQFASIDVHVIMEIDFNQFIQLSNLNLTLSKWFMETDFIDNLNRAITFSEKATYSDNQSPTNHALHLNMTVKVFRCTMDLIDAPPRLRLIAAKHANQFVEKIDIQIANRLLNDVVKFLSLTGPRNLTLLDQKFLISAFNGLISIIDTLMLISDASVYETLRIVEVDRGVIIQQLIDQIRFDTLRRSVFKTHRRIQTSSHNPRFDRLYFKYCKYLRLRLFSAITSKLKKRSVP